MTPLGSFFNNLERFPVSTYKDLLKQREELEKQIAEARSKELADAVGKVRALVAEYGLTSNDVFPNSKKNTTRSKVAPKYKNPSTGETWTGRGKPPAWIKDQNRDLFEIKE